MLDSLRELGVDVRLGGSADQGRSRPAPSRSRWTTTRVVEADQLLVAFGRVPGTHGIGLETLGLEAGQAVARRRRHARPGPRLAVRDRRRQRPGPAHAHGQVPGQDRGRRDPGQDGRAALRRRALATGDLHRSAGGSRRPHARRGEGVRAQRASRRRRDQRQRGRIVRRPRSARHLAARDRRGPARRRGRHHHGCRGGRGAARSHDRRHRGGLTGRSLARRAVVPHAQRALAPPARGLRALGRELGRRRQAVDPAAAGVVRRDHLGDAHQRGHARHVTARRRIDHELEAGARRLERPHRPQQQLDDRRVDERAVAEVDEQVSPGAGHAEGVGDRIEAGNVVVSAERHDGRRGGHDLDRHGTGRRAAAIEEVACVIGAFHCVHPAPPSPARALPRRDACHGLSRIITRDWPNGRSGLLRWRESAAGASAEKRRSMRRKPSTAPVEPRKTGSGLPEEAAAVPTCRLAYAQ